MSKRDIKTIATAKLKSEAKTILVLIIALTFVISVLVGISIYGLLYKDNIAVFIAILSVGLSSSLIIPILFISRSSLVKELELREV